MTELLRFDIVKIITVDALAPCVARTSAPMILIMNNKPVLVLREEGFQLPVSCKCVRMIKILDTFLCFLWKIQHLNLCVCTYIYIYILLDTIRYWSVIEHSHYSHDVSMMLPTSIPAQQGFASVHSSTRMSTREPSLIENDAHDA